MGRRWMAVVAVWAGVLMPMGVRAETPPGQAGAEANDARAQRRTPIVEVFEACDDAVVNISSTEIVEVRDPFGSLFDDFFQMPGMRDRMPSPGGTRQYTRTSIGSGFVIHPDGYIITNAHVVSRTNDRKVTFADGKDYDAEVIAFDTSRDLAVLKIDAGEALPVLKLGRSNDLMIGETVIAIGNPMGYQHTATTGIVSAVGRSLEVSREESLTELIQTDAPINPGNSGGPLLNVLGELIGVNTAVRTDAQNIGFAIPVDQLRTVLPDLLDVERRYHIILGMSVATLDEPRVTSVVADTPAASAGVREGDVVKAVDGRAMSGGVDFPIAMIGRKAGDTVSLQLERDGQPVQASITLAERPLPDGAKLAMEKLGLELAPLEADMAKRLGLRNGAGLSVQGVEPESPAEQLGVQRRDILIALGKSMTPNLETLGQMLERVHSGQTLPIAVLRQQRRGVYQLRGEIEAR